MRLKKLKFIIPKHLPNEWSKFSHSSSFEDTKQNMKGGVHHKFLIRALVGGASIRDDIVIATNKSTPEKIVLTKSKVHAIPRMLKFSVARGIRVAYEPMLDDGEIIVIDGKQVYKEIPSKGSTYETVIENIYKLAFQQLKGNESDVKLFGSFMGVLELMKKHLNKSQIKETHDRYIDLLWASKGQRGQELEVGNPELDFQVKSSGYSKLVSYLKLKDKSEKMVKDYYKDYGQRGKIRESFRNLLEMFGRSSRTGFGTSGRSAKSVRGDIMMSSLTNELENIAKSNNIKFNDASLEHFLKQKYSKSIKRYVIQLDAFMSYMWLEIKENNGKLTIKDYGIEVAK